MSKLRNFGVVLLFSILSMLGLTACYEGQGKIVEPVWVVSQEVRWTADTGDGYLYKTLKEVGTDMNPLIPELAAGQEYYGNPFIQYGYHIRGIGAEGFYFYEIDTEESWRALEDQIGTCHKFEWTSTFVTPDGSIREVLLNTVKPISCQEIGMKEGIEEKEK